MFTLTPYLTHTLKLTLTSRFTPNHTFIFTPNQRMIITCFNLS